MILYFLSPQSVLKTSTTIAVTGTAATKIRYSPEKPLTIPAITNAAVAISQMAAIAAYEGDQSCVEEMRVAFQCRRDLIVRLLREVPGLDVNEPEGAFYVFPKCSALFGREYDGGKVIRTASDFAMFLLEVAHVATVGGDAFGAPDCFRMSYATSDANITEALSRIRQALALLG